MLDKKIKIIFASSNQGKIHEMQSLLPHANFEIIPQAQLGIEDAEETGKTFVENALIKARFACKMSGLAVIADDSGLVTTALNGAPGIYSARFAGTKATSYDNIEKLLTRMKEVSPDKRAAYFYCVLVYLRHEDDPTPLICEGIWHGHILKAITGEKGFGYDPIFYDPIHECSAAQLTSAQKNKVSHRGQALRALLTKLDINN